MGPLGATEIIVLLLLIIALIALCVFIIYKYGKQKGRLKELERQIREKDPRH